MKQSEKVIIIGGGNAPSTEVAREIRHIIDCDHSIHVLDTTQKLNMDVFAPEPFIIKRLPDLVDTYITTDKYGNILVNKSKYHK